MLLSTLPIGFPKACCRHNALSDVLNALRAAGVQMKAIERKYRQYLRISLCEATYETGGVSPKILDQTGRYARNVLIASDHVQVAARQIGMRKFRCDRRRRL